MGPRGVPPPPPPASPSLRRTGHPLMVAAVLWRSAEGRGGGRPCRDPYLLRRISKAETKISWRNRDNATRPRLSVVPGRGAPHPCPVTGRIEALGGETGRIHW